MTPGCWRVPRFPLLAAFGGLVVVVAAVVVWYVYSDRQVTDVSPQKPARQDPRLAYAGPYLNVHPSVATVGSAKCAECHPAIAETYARHPMGQSVLPVSASLVTGTVPATFNALGSNFRLELAGDHLKCSETRPGPAGQPLFETASEIAVAIGSGSKGRSFLTTVDGFVLQSPISWFSQKHLWDASPGFPPELHIGRPVIAECLFCHTNGVVPVPGTVNRYETPLFRNGHAIGCERCHGPGSEHVRLQEAGRTTGRPDLSIVNPAHLAPALREAVCQQCHLEGEARVLRVGEEAADYRPGMPLDAVMRVLVRDHGGQDRKAVNHVEQMYLSKCFTGSKGLLGCITCHDPHDKPSPAVRATKYRAACLKCHDCSSPVEVRAKSGSSQDCVACHMPRFTAGDIVHTASTDHRIVRSPQPAVGVGQSRPKGFLFFPANRLDPLSVADGRDYALGLAEMALTGKIAAQELVRDGLPLLGRAITADADDVRAWEAKSIALQFAGRKSEALAAARQVLVLMPENERGLAWAATLAADAGDKELATNCLRQAAAVNPHHALYRQELSLLLARGGDWSAARAEAEEAIRLDPAMAAARAVLAIAELRGGDRDRAEKMFAIVTALAPANLAKLRAWYETERELGPGRGLGPDLK